MYEDETEAIRLQEIAVIENIRAAYANWFAGKPGEHAVPEVRRSASGCWEVQLQSVADAVRDQIDSKAPLAAVVALLQGRGTVDALRDVLVSDYIERNAGDVAQERAAWDAPSVYPFLTKEAT
jgi:hypothetical protein